MPPRRFLAITYGVSGSGKSYLSEYLLAPLRGVRIRSDVERKRIHGLMPDMRASPATLSGLYNARATEATFQRLAALAKAALMSNFPVIIDATFLKREHHARFQELARIIDVPFVIIHCRAPSDVLADRIASRAMLERDASDATADVLRQQQATLDALSAEEAATTVSVDTCEMNSLGSAAHRILDRVQGCDGDT